MKSAFSLFEMIIVIVLIAIISSMGVYKLFFTVDESSLLQAKTQVQLIKNALVQKQNENVLLGQSNSIAQLDNASINTKEELLFGNILSQRIVSTSHSEAKIASWVKESSNEYAIYLTSLKTVSFTYDVSSATFECDYNNQTCKEFYE